MCQVAASKHRAMRSDELDRLAMSQRAWRAPSSIMVRYSMAKLVELGMRAPVGAMRVWAAWASKLPD